MIIILFLIVCIIIGFFLAGPIAAIIVAANRKKISEMKALLEDFESINPTYRESKRSAYRKDLREIKAKIWPGDKKSVEEARDLMDSFERIPSTE